MTWSASQSGHHKSTEWRAEEHELLRSLIDAVEADEDTVVSTFTFNGNHVSATSLDGAKGVLAKYDEEAK